MPLCSLPLIAVPLPHNQEQFATDKANHTKSHTQHWAFLFLHRCSAHKQTQYCCTVTPLLRSNEIEELRLRRPSPASSVASSSQHPPPPATSAPACSERIPEGAAILDLMSSWVSHLPRDRRYGTVYGHGMNEKELLANDQLDEVFMADLNQEPTGWPVKDGELDAVICCVRCAPRPAPSCRSTQLRPRPCSDSQRRPGFQWRSRVGARPCSAHRLALAPSFIYSAVKYVTHKYQLHVSFSNF